MMLKQVNGKYFVKTVPYNEPVKSLQDVVELQSLRVFRKENLGTSENKNNVCSDIC